jgi:hypothetical protein
MRRPEKRRLIAPQSREYVSMNARRFEALTIAMTNGARSANRRTVLRGIAALAAMGIAPNAARAFDGGLAPVTAPVGGAACLSGADCAAGEICLNGTCAPRDMTGTTGTAGTTSTAGTTGTTVTGTTGEVSTGGEVVGTTPVAPPTTTAPSGVGGLIQPGEPLPARIFAGRCGALGAEPAFQLIDVGSVEGIEEDEAPTGALTAIPAEFSTTVVNTNLDTLLASEHAIDVRVDATDPATSIACGDIGGPVEAGTDGAQLAVGLQERGQSAYAGIAWLQQEADRTLVRVFLARGLDEMDTVTAAQPAAPEIAVVETPAAEAAPVEVEAAQAVGTPVIGELAQLGPGTRVVTSIDVNLRAEPSEDSPIITILGQGAELEVTGAPEDGWLPVVEPATGQRGFVSDQFVTIVV